MLEAIKQIYILLDRRQKIKFLILLLGIFIAS